MANKKTKYKPFTPGSNLNIVWQSNENNTPSIDGDSQKNGDDFSMIESKSPLYTDRSVTSFENNEAEKKKKEIKYQVVGLDVSDFHCTTDVNESLKHGFKEGFDFIVTAFCDKDY